MIFVPWKPALILWLVLCALLLVSGIGLSLRKGENPIAPPEHHHGRMHPQSAHKPA